MQHRDKCHLARSEAAAEKCRTTSNAKFGSAAEIRRRRKLPDPGTKKWLHFLHAKNISISAIVEFKPIIIDTSALDVVFRRHFSGPEMSGNNVLNNFLIGLRGKRTRSSFA